MTSKIILIALLASAVLIVVLSSSVSSATSYDLTKQPPNQYKPAKPADKFDCANLPMAYQANPAKVGTSTYNTVIEALKYCAAKGEYNCAIKQAYERDAELSKYCEEYLKKSEKNVLESHDQVDDDEESEEDEDANEEE